MKGRFFFIIIVIEVVIILFIGLKIYVDKQKVLEKYKINPIQKKSFVSTDSGKLKLFYEPKANNLDEQDVLGISNLKAHYTINNDSLNERFDYQKIKNPQTYRIVAIGDSFTFGMFVDTPNNYPEQLEEKLRNLKCESFNKFEVINLGVNGYDIQYAVERYKIRGQKYDPDLLIWLLKDDDFSQIAELLKPEIDFFITKGYESFNETARNWPAIQKAMEKINNTYGIARILKMQKNYLKSIRKYYPGEILFIFIPGKSEYKNLLNDFIKKDKKSSLLIIDRITDADLQFIDTHPNEKGYQMLSNEIYNFLLSKKIFACK